MTRKILLNHDLGSFVFREDGTLLGNGTEQEMLAGHPHAEEPTAEDIQKIMGFFKQPNFHDGLLQKNIAGTRKAISNSVNEDQLMVQAINSIEELQKTAHLHAKRLREWYGLFAPEISQQIEDHEAFAIAVIEKTPQMQLDDKKIELSMGNPNLEDDYLQAKQLAEEVVRQYALVKKNTDYLEQVMKSYCPNLLAVAGTMIGAKLLAETGSLKRLSQVPSSTIQLLGAEKALFRHLRNRSNRPPKHGYIISHGLIMRAPKNQRGKVARHIADKISIACKVDYFKGKFIGDSLKKELEEKFG